jgi:hypothetical protein
MGPCAPSTENTFFQLEQLQENCGSTFGVWSSKLDILFINKNLKSFSQNNETEDQVKHKMGLAPWKYKFLGTVYLTKMMLGHFVLKITSSLGIGRVSQPMGFFTYLDQDSASRAGASVDNSELLVVTEPWGANDSELNKRLKVYLWNRLCRNVTTIRAGIDYFTTLFQVRWTFTGNWFKEWFRFAIYNLVLTFKQRKYWITF